MPPRPVIQLYYDIVSPYSYLAFETLTRYASTGVWNFDLELCPASIGGVHKVANMTHLIPGAHPLKHANLKRDVNRLFAEYGIKATLPDNFPGKDHNTLSVARFLRVLKDDGPSGDLEACSRRLYDQFFGPHVMPGDGALLQSLTTSNPPLMSSDRLAKLIDASVSPENKKRVIDEADWLVKTHEAFGFPWIIVRKVGGETASFFGSDRMSNIAWWLGEGREYTGPNPKPKAAL